MIEATDQVKEKAIENFWADQEKKWQALEAVQTAQAQLEGSIASNSDAVAKSLVVPAVAPVVAPYSSYIYAPGIVAPGIIAPGLKAFPVQIPEAPKPEEKKPEEPKPEEKPEEEKSDSVQIESANVKTGEAEKEALDTKYIVGQTPLVTSFPLTSLKLAQPWGPVVSTGFAPGLFGTPVFAPTLLKTVW